MMIDLKKYDKFQRRGRPRTIDTPMVRLLGRLTVSQVARHAGLPRDTVASAMSGHGNCSVAIAAAMIALAPAITLNEIADAAVRTKIMWRRRKAKLAKLARREATEATGDGGQ
jgi:hypothetical protein